MKHETACQNVLLQIDSYLDRELAPAQEQALLAHVAQCPPCQAELRYAQALHERLTALPLMEAPAATLGSIERLMQTASAPTPLPSRRPLLARWSSLALAASLVAAVALGFGLGRLNGPGSAPTDMAQLTDPQPTDSQPQVYSQQEIIKAIEDMQLAISYLQEVTERTGTLVEGQLLQQMRRSVNAALPESLQPEEDSTNNGPI